MIDDEKGSILPLVAGYVALALAILLVCVNGIDLLITQRRVDALADAAALAASDGFTITATADGVSLELRPETAQDLAAEVVQVSPTDAWLIDVSVDSGATARAVVGSTWQPKLLGIIVPRSITLTATGTSRASLLP